jgi:hypothetical protein
VGQACVKSKLPPHIVFDSFFIKGGPLLMDLVTDEKAFECNIFEAMEQAFYEDVDPLDLYEVYKTCSGVGP